jgi:hypothetical protein
VGELLAKSSKIMLLPKRKTLNPQQVAELQERRRQGVLIKTLMQEYGLSKTSIYRYLKEETDAVGAHRAI